MLAIFAMELCGSLEKLPAEDGRTLEQDLENVSAIRASTDTYESRYLRVHDAGNWL
jgi:hypothetical protein